MDCHKPCGACTCGGSGICSGACNGTSCGCGKGRCDHRKAGCTSFRYGNCNNGKACIGPIQCRVVTCTTPWTLEPTCSSSAVRTDNNTRTHNRPCLQAAPPVHPMVGNWDGLEGVGIGFYDNRTGGWTLRHGLTSDGFTVAYGRTAGDRPVVGDWDGTGGDGIGIYRKGGEWHLSNSATHPSTVRTFRYGVQAGDIPVVGDWNGDGVDSVGIYRKGGEWHLSSSTRPVSTFQVFRYGVQPGDIPLVGDWNGDGIDGVGIFRRGEWHLSDAIPATTNRRITFGARKGDIPVVGDWMGTGSDSIGIYRPNNGTWYLMDTLSDPSPRAIVFGPTWSVS
jgi:hypothetical protein